MKYHFRCLAIFHNFDYILRLCTQLNLDRTATEVVHMLPEEDQSDFDKAVNALGQRFKPVDIEELRGLEFLYKFVRMPFRL